MRAIFTIFILISCIEVFAQYPDWQYFSEDFNPQSFAQEDEYIWIGTLVGIKRINRTDGSITTFDKTNSPLPIDWIRQICIDRFGTKWITNCDNGNLIAFDGVNWTVYDNTNSPLTGCGIKSIEIDDNDNIWLSTGCSEDGLYKFDGTNWTIYNSVPCYYIDELICTGNVVWIVSVDELTKYENDNWTTYDSTNSNISGEVIIGIDKDENGNIWLLHYNGIEKFDGTDFYLFNEQNTNMPHFNFYDISVDTNSKVWVGGSPYYPSDEIGGLMSFDGNSWVKYDSLNSGFKGTICANLFADSFNNIWYGCSISGIVGQKSENQWTTYDLTTAGLDYGFVRKIKFNQNGDAFIATSDPSVPGFSLYKFDWKDWVGIPYFNSDSFGYTLDSYGNLYIKNTTGLKKFDGVNWIDVPGTPALDSEYPISKTMNCLQVDHTGGIWLDYLVSVEIFYDEHGKPYYVNHEGMAYYDGNEWSTFNSSNSQLPDTPFSSIQVDNQNHIWLSSTKGLINYNGAEWITYDTSNSGLSTNSIGKFLVDSIGNIWFSNGKCGFNKFNLVETIEYNNPYNNYPGEGDLAFDIDGSIWQQLIWSVVRFDGSEWSRLTYNNSPLPNSSNLHSLSIDKNGNKWIGTQHGFFVYKQGGVITSSPFMQVPIMPISVYPNPFDNYFHIELKDQTEEVEVKVFDMLSHLVFSSNLSHSQKILIPRNNLKSGVYFYQVKSGEKIIATGKIIAE